MNNIEKLLATIRDINENSERAKASSKMLFDFVPFPNGPGIQQLAELVQILPELSYTHGPWIAGGSGRRLLQGQSLEDGDIDIFFYSRKQWDAFKEALEAYEVTYKSDNAITFLVNGIRVQIIKRKFYESLDAVFEDFDFTACQIGSDGRQLILTPTAHRDITNKILRLADDGRYCNQTLLNRFTKYINYGFIPVKGLFGNVIKSAINKHGKYGIFEDLRGDNQMQDSDAWYNGRENKDLLDPLSGVNTTVSRGTAVPHGVSHGTL